MNHGQALAKQVFIPLLDFKQGRASIKCFEELQRFQWLPSDEIHKIQRRKLKALLKFSYDTVPYYHRVFRELKLKPSDIHDLCDLEKLPILTKDVLRKNFWDLISTKYNSGQLEVCSTSGTTGEPVSFIKSPHQKSWENGAGYLLTSWYGFNPGYKHAVIWALSSPLSVWQKKLNILLRQRVFNSFQMTREGITSFARELATFKPEVLRGYSNMLHFFALFVKKNNIEVHPGAVVATGEELLDYQRRDIKDVFGCDVFSFYASREVSAIAAECPMHQGHHIMADNLILETIKDGLPLESEEIGAITLTNLCNYAMPLIRYQLGDLGSISTEKCACGRTLPLLTSIDGRISDILVDRHSKYTASPSVHFIFKGLPVEQYQIIQESEHGLIIKLVRGKTYTEQIEKTILQRISKYLGSFDVVFDYVDLISFHKSGKKRVIISNLPMSSIINNNQLMQ